VSWLSCNSSLGMRCAISFGSVPLRRLDFRLRNSSPDSTPSPEGIEPVSPHRPKSSASRLLRVDRVPGMLPWKKLLARLRDCRLRRALSEEGMGPVRRLEERVR